MTLDVSCYGKNIGTGGGGGGKRGTEENAQRGA